MVAFYTETGFLGDLDICFWRREENCGQAVHKNRAALLSRQKLAAHPKEASGAALPENPPQHFRDGFMLGNTCSLCSPRYFT